MNIQLNEEEKLQFQKDGTKFIDDLAMNVSSNPPKYERRHIQEIKR